MFYRNYVHRNNLFGAGLVGFLVGAAAWAMFGDSVKRKFDESSEFQDLKKQVYDRASQISDITQDKYNQIVDEITDKYAQAKGISSNELKDLVNDLRWHWRRIK